MEADNISIRLHGNGPHGAKPKEEAIAEVVIAIQERQGYPAQQSRSFDPPDRPPVVG